MTRKISFDDLKKAVSDAYDKTKLINEGTTDPRITENNCFGISVVLTDGRKFNIGDTNVATGLAEVARLATAVTLLSQNTRTDLADKIWNAGSCCCHKNKTAKADIPVDTRGLRYVSAIQPAGDRDGKMNVIMDTIIGLAGSETCFDDALYKKLTTDAAAADTENKIASAGFDLYDDTPDALDVYDRLQAVKVTTEQLATMGATVAADGRNPVTGKEVFDGANASGVTFLTGHKGMHKMTHKWMLKTGLPTRSGFTGLIVSILPGFGAIAAYSTRLCPYGNTVRGTQAILQIADTLGLDVFASARICVEP